MALEPFGDRRLERWRASGPVSSGRDGDLAWSEDGALQFGVIEFDEPEALPGFAAARLVELERPFTDFFAAYDRWRSGVLVAPAPQAPAPVPTLTVDVSTLG